MFNGRSIEMLIGECLGVRWGRLTRSQSFNSLWTQLSGLSMSEALSVGYFI